MSTLKFLHAADIHLGRPFSGLRRSHSSLGRILCDAGYTAWQRIVEIAIDRGVSFVTIGGDTFDGPNPSIRARAAFRNGINALNDAGIPVYMVLGNHDSLRDFPDSSGAATGLHLFGPEPEVKEIPDHEGSWRAYIYGASFAQPAVKENLARCFQRDSYADIAIGLLHTNVAGMEGHDDYAPCHLDDLRAAGMDIWCLGHVHSPTILSEDPLVLYPGTSQAAHSKETGLRGCYLITVSGRGAAAAELIPVAPVVWERVVVDCGDASTDEEVLDAMEDACKDLEFCGDGLEAAVVSIEITGAGSVETAVSRERTEDLLEILSERMSGHPIPLFPVSISWPKDTAGCIPLSLHEEEGFVGDFLRLCRKAATTGGMAGELVLPVDEELVKMINSRFIHEDERPRKLLTEDNRLAERLADVQRLVVRAFMESGG